MAQTLSPYELHLVESFQLHPKLPRPSGFDPNLFVSLHRSVFNSHRSKGRQSVRDALALGLSSTTTDLGEDRVEEITKNVILALESPFVAQSIFDFSQITANTHQQAYDSAITVGLGIGALGGEDAVVWTLETLFPIFREGLERISSTKPKNPFQAIKSAMGTIISGASTGLKRNRDSTGSIFGALEAKRQKKETNRTSSPHPQLSENGQSQEMHAIDGVSGTPRSSRSTTVEGHQVSAPSLPPRNPYLDQPIVNTTLAELYNLKPKESATEKKSASTFNRSTASTSAQSHTNGSELDEDSKVSEDRPFNGSGMTSSFTLGALASPPSTLSTPSTFGNISAEHEPSTAIPTSSTFGLLPSESADSISEQLDETDANISVWTEAIYPSSSLSFSAEDEDFISSTTVASPSSTSPSASAASKSPTTLKAHEAPMPDEIVEVNNSASTLGPTSASAFPPPNPEDDSHVSSEESLRQTIIKITNTSTADTATTTETITLYNCPPHVVSQILDDIRRRTEMYHRPAGPS